MAADDERLLIGDMMGHLGIEPAGGVLPDSALRYDRARANCAMCGDKPACRKWLDAHEVAAVAPGFCPNGDTLFELRFDQKKAG